jgi:mono/diheme cytochrome c family protein
MTLGREGVINPSRARGRIALMNQFQPALLAALLWLDAPSAAAQDAARGARLYLGLPGGEASCVECHGPDPSLDRNRLLNAARGPSAIDEALRKAAAMGYLSDLLSPVDRADLSAFLARVNAEAEGSTPAAVWPWGLEFGRVAPGAAAAPQPVRLRNLGAGELALEPRLRSLAPDGAVGLTLAHDCPTALAPGAECTAHVGLVAGGGGAVQAALEWGDAAAGLRPVGVAATVSDVALGTAAWLDAPADNVVALEAAPAGEAVATLTMHNAGAAPLVLGVPALTGPGRGAFRLEGGGCAPNLVLPADGRCTVRVVATAPSAGRQEALLQWRNDGGHAPPRSLEVQAVGSATPSPLPPPVTSPAPGPAPAPIPAPQVDVGGGGGCSTRAAWESHRPDPLLPGLVVAAALLVWRRARNAAQAVDTQPASEA